MPGSRGRAEIEHGILHKIKSKTQTYLTGLVMDGFDRMGDTKPRWRIWYKPTPDNMKQIRQ
jgi:hypothetical protein